MSPRVLIVEDDDDHMTILTRYFLAWDWDVVGVKDTTDPIVPPERLALIVMDRAVPPRSGDEVLRQLRAAGATAPAVVVTCMPTDLVNGEFDGLGVVEIIDKQDAYEVLSCYAKRFYPRDVAGENREPPPREPARTG